MYYSLQKEKEKGIENLPSEVIVENFPGFKRDMGIQIQDIKRILSRFKAYCHQTVKRQRQATNPTDNELYKKENQID